MPRLPPPESVTLLPPLIRTRVTSLPPLHESLQLCVLHVTSVFFTTIVTGLRPQLKEMSPPERTALASLAYVHDLAVPLPITFFLNFALATAGLAEAATTRVDDGASFAAA